MTKSNEKSDLLRIEGNHFFSQKCYYNAMLKFNESLSFAEPNRGQIMGLTYGNRSALYFEMKLFQKCLRNINLAKQNQYPEENMEVLYKREEKCLLNLKRPNEDKNDSDLHNFFQLCYPSHKKVPFIADSLEVKYNDVYGRHIVTNKSLKAGDVIAIEHPFSKIVQDKFIHQICSWCFNGNLMDLTPCSSCTKAMFCSEECEEKAFKTFHNYECPLRDMISNLNATLQMALRTFFEALSIFGDLADDLKDYLIENSKPCTIFDFHDIEEPKNKLLAINSLVASDKIDDKREIFEKIFQITPKLKDMWSNHGDFITNFLKHQIQIGTLNYHEIYVWPLKKSGLQDNDVDSITNSLAYQRGTIAAGNGSYPFTSLLNHDCAPNIGRIFINDKIVLVVQRTINKGDQLFDSYGYHFTNTSKDIRHSELQKQYGFKCNCDACSHDWPLLSALRIYDQICLNKAKKECRELSLTDLNRKKAINKYKELCGIINKNQKNFPSLEICSIMQSAAAYLEMILKPHLQFS